MKTEIKVDWELLRKKITFYREEQIVVHVILKDSKKFYNGVIVEEKPIYFLINDRQVGKIPVLYSEIYRIEPYERKVEKQIK